MFRSVLVANRGEIAVRIIKTLRAMGIRSVVVCSIPDRQGLAVRTADAHVVLEGATATETYLDIPAVIAAALDSGCDAIHPGYGFLSERPEFAERCIEAGLTFIGPPPAVLHASGDKAAARQLALANDVPVVPGWDGDDDDGVLIAEAERIGYPIMIKARGGGGGRGMREVTAPEAMPEAVASARREAQSAFGDSRLLLEQLVVAGHHVEIQVLADSHGNLVHLGERDCSVQRRHQKLIEESPSPVVDDALRGELTAAALRLARSLRYVNAGTFEFLVGSPAASGRRPFYFLEVNPRLQVEHPVTELVTGLDLVELQVRVAAGEPLPFTQRQVSFSGHAIECRINAEDPGTGFAPNSGRLSECSSSAARFDAGFSPGDMVPPQYDSLLGKLIVHTPDRASAVATAISELSNLRISPLRTTAPLQLAVMRTAAFQDGAASIDWLERELPDLLDAVPAPSSWWVAAAGALARPAGRCNSPFACAEWVGASPRSLWLDDGSVQREVSLVKVGEERGVVQIDGIEHRYHATRDGIVTGGNKFTVSWDGPRELCLSSHPETRRLRVVRPPHSAHRSHGTGGGAAVVVAPLAGTVAEVRVAPGDAVADGQVLVVLEAMKMEHQLAAPSDGTIAAVHVTPGQVVPNGLLLVELTAAN